MTTNVVVSIRIQAASGTKLVEVGRVSAAPRVALEKAIEEALSSIIGERVRLLMPPDPPATMPAENAEKKKK